LYYLRTVIIKNRLKIKKRPTRHTITMTLFDDMMKKAASADGFLAALDQSGGSTPNALKGYGVPDDVSAANN
jgi:hypothetical protein